MNTTPFSTAALVIQNWSGLHPAQTVVVHEPSGEPYLAAVDTITEDSGVVWVVAERDHQRRAFDCREGIVITQA